MVQANPHTSARISSRWERLLQRSGGCRCRRWGNRFRLRFRCSNWLLIRLLRLSLDGRSLLLHWRLLSVLVHIGIIGWVVSPTLCWTAMLLSGVWILLPWLRLSVAILASHVVLLTALLRPRGLGPNCSAHCQCCCSRGVGRA